MIGFITGVLLNFMWLGYNLVHSFILFVAFNYLAPILVDRYAVPLPFTEVRYWHVFAALVVLRYVGEAIQTITPKLVSVNSNASDTN